MPARIALLVAAALALSPTALAAPNVRSTATITGSFADACRDFSAHSSKDISHVEIHYADGRVVKDETISRPDYAIDGGVGDEIEFAIVKSGTTLERFDCVQANSPPTALLEIETPPVDQTLVHCYDFFSGGLACEQSSPRTDWTRASVFHWGCGAFSDFSQCPFAISFRGTSSSDPDDDIASWSLDFGDGTSASGDWSTNPPTAVAHTFVSDVYTITLTVTDSAGQSDSDAMQMDFIDQTPD